MRTVTVPALLVAIAATGAIWVLSFWASGGATALTRPVSALAVAAIAALTLAIGLERRIQLGRSGAIALAVGAAFAAWAFASTLWAPRTYEARMLAALVTSYVMVLGIGLLIGRSRNAARLTIGLLTLGSLATAGYLLWHVGGGSLASFQGARMIGPIGYFNAQAAMLVLLVPALLALATARDLHALWRAGAIAAVPPLLLVSLLAQSRGSLLALAAAWLVLIVITPRRLRLLWTSAIAGAATVIALPALREVWHVAEQAAAGGAIDEAVLRSYAVMCLVATGVALVAGLAWALADNRIRWPRWTLQAARIATIALVVVSLGAAWQLHGSEAQAWWSEQRDALSDSGPAIEASSSSERLATLGTGSAIYRVRMWRIAGEAWHSEPIRGLGARGWEPYHYEHRPQVSDRYIKQPHSAPMEILAELGLVGALLAGAVVLALAARVASLLSSGASSDSRILVAGITGSLVYVGAHSTLEWFSYVPSVSLAAALLAGLLLAAPWTPAEQLAPRRVRWAILGGGALLVVATLWVAAPGTLSAYRMHQAEQWRGSLDGKLTLLTAAHDANPVDPEPLRRRVVQLALGRPEPGSDDAALAAGIADELVALDPNNWNAWRDAGDLYAALGDESASEMAFARATQLNPLEAELAGFAERASRSKSAGSEPRTVG